MADTLVESLVSTGSEGPYRNPYGPYWISTSTGAMIFVDSSEDIVAMKTTDGGATWSAKSAAENSTARVISVWFDGENPGNTGDKIHCVWNDSAGADLTYAAYDIGDGSWSTPVDIDAALGGNGEGAFLCQTRAGGFVAGCIVSAVGSVAYKSADGSSWSSITSPYEVTNATDMALPVSVDTGDTADAGILYWDGSANQISVKMWDDSAGSWTETAITTAVEQFSYVQWARATRLSDGHTVFAVWNELDTASADLEVWDLTLNSIAAPTITAKTNVITATAEAIAAGVFVDQANDDLYVAYCIGTAASSLVSVVYKKSTDGGGTWGSQTAYSEDAEDDYRAIHCGAMLAAGGRFQPLWFDDDDNDIFINLTNDIEIAAAAGGDPEGSLIRGKLIRGGLLRGGVLVG